MKKNRCGMGLTTWNAELRVCSCSIGRRPLPRCGEMRSSAGPREDWLEVPSVAAADDVIRKRIAGKRIGVRSKLRKGSRAGYLTVVLSTRYWLSIIC